MKGRNKIMSQNKLLDIPVTDKNALKISVALSNFQKNKHANRVYMSDVFDAVEFLNNNYVKPLGIKMVYNSQIIINANNESVRFWLKKTTRGWTLIAFDKIKNSKSKSLYVKFVISAVSPRYNPAPNLALSKIISSLK